MSWVWRVEPTLYLVILLLPVMKHPNRINEEFRYVKRTPNFLHIVPIPTLA